MILTSRNQLYTGIATDVERRWQEHLDMADGKAGARGAKFFRSQRPVKLVYREECEDRSRASQREAAIKRLTRAQKLALFQHAE